MFEKIRHLTIFDNFAPLPPTEVGICGLRNGSDGCLKEYDRDNVEEKFNQ